jgi:hypothetical protein
MIERTSKGVEFLLRGLDNVEKMVKVKNISTSQRGYTICGGRG